MCILLPLMKVKVKSLSPVRLFATPRTYSPPGSSIHGIFQPRILEWVAISSSRVHSWVTVSDDNSPVFLISELRVLPRQWRKAQGRKQNETDQLQLKLKLQVAKFPGVLMMSVVAPMLFISFSSLEK